MDWCPEIEQAVVFGSRVKGDYNQGLDSDIGIYGRKTRSDILSKLHSLLEDDSPIALH